MKIGLKTFTIVLLINQLSWACATCGCMAQKPKSDSDSQISCKAHKTEGTCKSRVSKSYCKTGCKAKTTCQGACKLEKQVSAPDMAPEFTLANYDGSQVSLNDYKGKILVLEWFNYKCPFCVYHYETENTMNNLAKKYADKNVQFLAINSTSWQTTEQNMAFAEKNKITYPILDDRSGKVGKAYGATRTPHMYIINEQGKIVYQGALDNAPLGKLPDGHDKVMNFVDMALAELTQGKPVTIQKTREYGCTVKYAEKEK
jgi:peroxiredoxin